MLCRLLRMQRDFQADEVLTLSESLRLRPHPRHGQSGCREGQRGKQGLLLQWEG